MPVKQIGWYPGLGGVGGGNADASGGAASNTVAPPAQGLDPAVNYSIHLVQDAAGKVVPLKLGGLGGQAALPIALQNRPGNPVTLAPQAAPPPVGAILGRDTDQDLTPSTDDLVSWERVDRNVGESFCSCDPTEVGIVTPGWYQVAASVKIPDTSDSEIWLKAKRNGVTILQAPAVKVGSDWYARMSEAKQFANGDVVTLAVNSDGLAPKVKADGASTPYLEVMFQGT